MILRRMGSLYEHGRNHSLVKLKVSILLLSCISVPHPPISFELIFIQSTQSDKEAIVVGVDHSAVNLKLYVHSPPLCSLHY